MLFSPQIPLPLEPQRHGRFEDFVPGPNHATIQALRSLLADGERCVFLSGAPGNGKTHLLNAACHACREQGRTAFYLGLDRLPSKSSEALEGLEAMDLVCVDDLQEVAGEAAWEEGMFHFINRLRERRGRLLVASEKRLSTLPLALPDLESRLSWGLRLELVALGDEDRLEVIRRRATALGFEVPGEVAAYLLKRASRNPGQLAAAVEALRQAAFTEKRRVTMPLARQVLQEQAQ